MCSTEAAKALLAKAGYADGKGFPSSSCGSGPNPVRAQPVPVIQALEENLHPDRAASGRF
jgi:ABC-type transport system substrate-binding protein